MSYELMNRFSLSYESGASASYMVIRANEDEKVLDYQVEMLNSNIINNILPFEIRQKDGRVSFYYNITSKLSLSQFLKRRKLKRNEFLRILSSISRALLDCRYYLLYDRCAVMEADLIFITPDTLEISLAYLPITLDININDRFKDFMLDIIIHCADIDENNSDNFLQRIISYLRSDTLCVKGFYRLLTELMQHDTSIGSLPNKSAHWFDDSKEIADQTEQKQCDNSKKIRIRRDLSSAHEVPSSVPHPQSSEIQEVKKNKSYDFEIKSAPMAAAIALQIFIIVLIVLGRNFLNSLNNNTAATYAGVALVILAIEVLALKKLFGFSNMEKEKDCSVKVPLARKGLNTEKPDVWNMTDHLDQVCSKDLVEGLREKPVELPRFETIKRKEYSDHEVEIAKNPAKEGEYIPQLDNNGSDTVLLEQEEEKYAYLQYENDGLTERVLISKQDFIIGRLKGQVDYMALNSAIGKMHAEVTYKDNTYYIKDLNSRNGTFINGFRINSNMECEIKNKDKITLANTEYTFVTP